MASLMIYPDPRLLTHTCAAGATLLEAMRASVRIVDDSLLEDWRRRMTSSGRRIAFAIALVVPLGDVRETTGRVRMRRRRSMPYSRRDRASKR